MIFAMIYYDFSQFTVFLRLGLSLVQAWVGEILAALKAGGEEIHVPQDFEMVQGLGLMSGLLGICFTSSVGICLNLYGIYIPNIVR